MKRSPEIEALVERFLAARSAGDVRTVRNLYSDSEDLRSIGSDGHEWFRGQEVVEISRVHWEELTVSSDDLLRLEAFENGTTGWAAVEQERTLPDGDSFIYRMTIIFELDAGAWKIVHTHFSVPVSNEEVAGVKLTRTLSDLLDSMGESDMSEASARSGTATFLFTDIVGSTQLSVQLGENVWRDIITAHFDAVRHVVEHEGGSVVKTLGDGAMYNFASGSSALRAAVRIQQSVIGSSEQQLSLRVGVHTGDVARSGRDYVGSTVAKAARVAAAADGGQILVSSTTAGMVNPTEFEFDAPFTAELKGLPGRHELRPLHWS